MIKCRCIKGQATDLLAKNIPVLDTGKEETHYMKKKLFAIITAAAMAMSLVACGGVTITSVGLPSDMSLEKGATQQLQLECSAEGEVAADKIAEAAGKLTVEWSSSDEAIVTVDAEGNVTAVEAGEAYVTATVKDKDGLTATTLVRVAVTPTGVEAPETLELVTNGENTKNLDAKIVPEDATGVKLAYESSDENVATVDENGMVTAVADGECVITAYVVSSEEETPVDTEVADSEPVDATSTDSGEVADATVANSDAAASESAVVESEAAESAETAESEQVFEPLEQETAEPEETADTKVLDPDFATLMEDLKAETKVTVTTKVDAVTLSQNEGILNVGKSVTLTATVTPEEIAADTTVTWSSSDEAVATVDSNGKVTAVATGNATITATAGEESASCDITVEKAASKPAASSKPTTSTSGNTSTGTAAPSAPAAAAPSNPAPAPAPSPAAPAPAPAAPAPAPEPSYNPPSDPSLGYDGNERCSSPIDNGCPSECVTPQGWCGC